MTIQLSVTVWTVVCFVLLMLILHNLLFKPVLALLDKRNKRIEDAAKKKAEYDALQSKNESLIIESKKVFLENKLKETKEELEAIRLQSKADVEKAQELRLKTVDNYRIKTDSEQEEILKILEEHSVSLAQTFANSLIKG
ncbi:MAG: hypothetical protein E7551_08985 [Ruminococcaceae bacterium]|nr:hypothetical protein [Oscillospiraceae bacterium]